MKQRDSFRSKLLIVIGLIFFISLSIITIINNQIAKKSLQNRLIEHEIPSLINNIIAEVDIQLMTVASGLLVIAEDPFVQEWIALGEPIEDVSKIENRLKQNVTHFKTMGSNLVSWNTKNYYTFSKNSFNVNKVKDTDTWFPAFKDSGKSFVINAYTNHEALGEVAFMNVRIDTKGQFQGLISVAINLTDFVNTVKNIKVGDHGLNFMVDTNGLVMLHEDKMKIRSYNLKDDSKYAEYIDNITSSDSYSFEYLNENGDLRYVNTRFVPELGWYLITEASEKELFQDINKAGLQSALVSLIFLITGILLLYFLTGIIIKNLKLVNTAVDEISEGDGDLTKLINIRSKDEAGLLSLSINRFVTKLKDMIIDVKEVAKSSNQMGEVLATNAEEISSTVVEISSTMNSINDKTDKLSNVINTSDKSIGSIREMILNLNSNVEKENEYLIESSAAIEEMLASIHSVTKISENKKDAIEQLTVIATKGESDMNSTVKAIKDINNSVEAMVDIIEVINGVSEQINILSMNAAIEAAHAGDAGKGFAVVADEIRKLAETTSDNTSVMSSTVSGIIKFITVAGDLSSNTGESINTIMSEIREVSGSLSEVIASLSEISEGTNQITTTLDGLVSTSGEVKRSSLEMDKASVEIEDSFSHVTSLAAQNKNGIQEISLGLNDISKALSDLSLQGGKNSEIMSHLSDVVNKFKTE